MKKIDRIINREAARVLCIEALNMLEKAKDKMAEIEWDDKQDKIWNKAYKTVWDLHVQSCDKYRQGK